MTHPLCVAGRAMVVSRFTSLHDDDKGGRITRPPLSWSGRATCRTLWRWGHFNWPHPLRQPQSYRQDWTKKKRSPFHESPWWREPASRFVTLVCTACLTCASQAPLRSAHFVTMLHVTCYNKVVPYCAGWAYRKYIVYIIYIYYIYYIFFTPPKFRLPKEGADIRKVLIVTCNNVTFFRLQDNQAGRMSR